MAEQAGNYLPPEVITRVDVAKKFLQVAENAAAKKLDCDLTFQEVEKLMKQKLCFYTGEPFSVDAKARTFDRLDNSKGYVMGNVVACQKWINQAKGNLSVETIQLLAAGIAKQKKAKG